MAYRRLILDNAFDRVVRSMNLRRPQRESLEKLHELMVAIDEDLPNLSRARLLEQTKDSYPDWAFGDDYPHATFALAVGVGKTRLTGAVIAYMYLARQSRHFGILAPSATILAKFLRELDPSSPKYLFVEPGLVPDPQVWHSGNIETFAPDEASPLDPRNPLDIFVLSPQSLVGPDKRVFQRSEFVGTSPHDYLASIPDLITVMDEAHHLGGLGKSEAAAWTEAVRGLKPRLQLHMTATPRQEAGSNLLYSYDLRTALRERMYTKGVNVIVRKRSERVLSEEDWDHLTLDFALQRLARKEEAISLYRGALPFPSIQPVLLVAAENTQHADEVAAWLETHRGFGSEEILVTHSRKTKKDEDTQRLVGIETPQNKVRVVVNVFELTEGWDVTNVYVIAPLRKMGTYQGAMQTMGRGLRLPAGRRVDDVELDTLDVLCFGKESLADVLNVAIKDYGDVEIGEPGLEVVDAADPALTRELKTKTADIALATKTEVVLPRVAIVPAEPQLDFDVKAGTLAGRTAVEFQLGSESFKSTQEGVQYEADVFVRLVNARIFQSLRYLSEPLHRTFLTNLTRNFLSALKVDLAAPINLDWVLVAEILKDEIDKRYRKSEISYKVSSGVDRFEFESFQASVPESYKGPLPKGAAIKWEEEMFRVPIDSWERCCHAAAIFDTAGEARVAWTLDSDTATQWWARNDPAAVRVPTPIGMYEPDFVFQRSSGSGSEIVMLEVKGGWLWQPQDSDARIRARAASAWAAAVNSASPALGIAHWVVLDDDVKTAASIGDLQALDVAQMIG